MMSSSCPTQPSAFEVGLGANRDAFVLPEDVAYFNTANLSLQLRAVREAGHSALDKRGRPWTISSEDWFKDSERARALFAQLIGADSDGVALIPATSYGFAVAARNLPLRAGQRVLVLAEEYPSGIYTWRRAASRSDAEILTVQRQPGQSWSEAMEAATDERVAIVSVPNVHWTDGSLIDLTSVARRSREVGAALVIDGSQSLGALPLDVQEVRPDFVISVGYKWLLGPFGLGYLYVGEEHRNGEPLEENWILRVDSEDFARLVDYRDDYQPGSRRFDVGERTKFELMPMAVAALSQLLTWEVGNVAEALREVTGRIARGAQDLGLEPLAPGQRGPHMLGIVLGDEMRMPALSALADANCFAAIRGRSLRIAPHLHTNQADIDRLLAALSRAIPGS
jgi:selenocysteine lyase/cysteine desulfurase